MGMVWNESEKSFYDMAGRKIITEGRLYPLERDDSGLLFFVSESLERYFFQGESQGNPVSISFSHDKNFLLSCAFHY